MITMFGKNNKPLIILFFSGAVTAADPQDLEALLKMQVNNLPANVEVSTANRIQQSAAQAPQITYLVTSAEIEQMNLRTLGEILTLFPGVYASSDTTYGYLTSRGIGRPGDYNSRLLFLVDGTRVNDNIYDAGIIGNNFFLDTRLIERVEYSPGTGSALYGNNAYLGVVNIISKKVNDLQGATFVAMTTDNQQHDYLMSYGLRDESGHEGYVAMSQNVRRDIPFPDKTTAPLLNSARSSNTDDNTKFTGNYTYRRFSLDFSTVQRDRIEPDLTADGRIADSHIQNDSSFVAARFSHRISTNAEWSSHLSSNRMHFKTISPTLFPTPTTPALLIFDVKGAWANLDQRLKIQADEYQQWLFGFDLQRDHRQTYRFSINEQFTLSGISSDNLRYGLFANHEWQIADQHSITTGLRYDHSSQDVREFSPKFGWSWQFSPQQQFRFNYGRAFRAPNEYELETNRYFEVQLPKSEQISTVEFAWQRDWQNGWHHTLSLYQNKLTNLITADYGTSTLVEFFNDQPVTAKGIEFSAQKNWSDFSELTMSLSLQQARYQNDQRLTNAPEQMAKITYHRQLWHDQLTANYRLFASSKRYGVLADQPGFARQDLVVSWQAEENLALQLGLKNLTDHRYTDAPLPSAESLLQQGRTVELTIRWSFY